MIELMTIGYEGLSLQNFLRTLQENRVQRIVDVRELPISRKPGFAKTALSTALKSHGIEYEHMVELGCPANIRHAYREDKNWERYTKRFKAYLEKQDKALQHLAERIVNERCCLMCFEANFNYCHRSYVAEKVVPFAKSPVKISHIMAGGGVQPDFPERGCVP